MKSALIAMTLFLSVTSQAQISTQGPGGIGSNAIQPKLNKSCTRLAKQVAKYGSPTDQANREVIDACNRLPTDASAQEAVKNLASDPKRAETVIHDIAVLMHWRAAHYSNIAIGQSHEPTSFFETDKFGVYVTLSRTLDDLGLKDSIEVRHEDGRLVLEAGLNESLPCAPNAKVGDRCYTFTSCGTAIRTLEQFLRRKLIP